MKIIIFGIGGVYRQNKKKIAKEDEIVAFIDNDKQKQEQQIEGIKVYPPAQIMYMSYDIIIIMSNSALEMKNQLLKLGCKKEKIRHYIEYINHLRFNKLEIFFPIKERNIKDKCLVITESLDYHGGAIAAVYLAVELINKGYEVVIAASKANSQFIDEFRENGIFFLIYQNLRFAKWNELFWIKNFSKIIVNTYPMILCAIEISKYRKVAVWLHESNIIYSYMNFWKDIIAENVLHSNVFLYAVSEVAKKNFVSNVIDCGVKILPYGIPDTYQNISKINTKLRFAVVGTIHPIKQQLLFLEAIERLSVNHQISNEFLIIGKTNDDLDYMEKVLNKAKAISNVRVINGLTRKEMDKIYESIDVLIISSMQETMSLVATEAMMHGKVCILCDTAGMAKFIEHNKNGLLYKTNDVKDLSRQMEYCIENKDYLFFIGKEARKTYINYFTMQRLGERIEKILVEQEN